MGMFPRFIQNLVVASGYCAVSLASASLFSPMALAANTQVAALEILPSLQADSTLNPHGQGSNPPSGMEPVGSPCCTDGAGSR